MQILKVETTGGLGARWLDIWFGERAHVSFGTYEAQVEAPAGGQVDLEPGQFSASFAIRALGRGFHFLARTPRWYSHL